MKKTMKWTFIRDKGFMLDTFQLNQIPWCFCLTIPNLSYLEGYQIADAAAALAPDLLDVNRDDLELNFFATYPVQIENRGGRSFVDNGEGVDPEIVENQRCSAHGGNVETTPARRKTGEEQAVGAGKD